MTTLKGGQGLGMQRGDGSLGDPEAPNACSRAGRLELAPGWAGSQDPASAS